VILEVLYPNRRPVRTAADLQRALNQMKTGDVISLNVYAPQQQATRVVNVRVGG